MALKPTIYKFRIALSDLDRNHYDALNLTVAQHPSETVERMMVRVLAFCLNAEEGLTFSKGGLSEPDDPDILKPEYDRLSKWIDVGEPAFERLKKATRVSDEVKVYSFNAKSDVWWSQSRDKLAALLVSVYQFSWPEIQKLSGMTTRVMDMSVTISGDSVHVASEAGECELKLLELRGPNAV
ncbi:YaeQ family protein [Proteobacteria bacterium 005FR1]|nr:YaeQ family protein [Proteobacteria bacterium 005FR1]